MYGYLLAILAAVIVLAICLASLGRAGPTPHDPKAPVEKPVGPDQPAADEPTPDRSTTATTAEVETARRHTPPA